MGAHARGKFFVLDLAAKARGRVPVLAPLALEAVRRINAIFVIEREINGVTAEERLAVRRIRVAPLVAELEAWMRSERAKLSRHAEVAKAMDYMLKRWAAPCSSRGQWQGPAAALELDATTCQTGGMSPARKTAFDSLNEIATVRIELRDSDPLIWREVEVPTSVTLKVLHDIIQAAMGWFDYHLWEFRIGNQRYGLAMDEDWGTKPRREASKVRLRDALKPRETTIEYLYDFGDSWEHRLTVTGIRAGQPDLSYPRYIGGEWNAPPEDCGGIPGFYAMLDAVADPDHPDHADAKEWLDDYDPKLIDELPIKYALGRIANQRKAARARLAKKS